MRTVSSFFGWAFSFGCCFALSFAAGLKGDYNLMTFEIFFAVMTGINTLLAGVQLHTEVTDMQLLLKQARFPLQKDANG